MSYQKKSVKGGVGYVLNGTRLSIRKWSGTTDVTHNTVVYPNYKGILPIVKTKCSSCGKELRVRGDLWRHIPEELKDTKGSFVCKSCWHMVSANERLNGKYVTDIEGYTTTARFITKVKVNPGFWVNQGVLMNPTDGIYAHVPYALEVMCPHD